MRAFYFSLLAATAAMGNHAALAAAETNHALPNLSAYLWKSRVLVIDTPAATSPSYQTQAAALLPAWPGLLERDLHIITRDSAPAFRVRLIGKDGGVKLDQAMPVSISDLFALIDAMPMRRAEKK